MKYTKYTSFEVTVNLDKGLGLRPATDIMDECAKYNRQAYIINKDFHKARHANAKKSLDIIALNAEKGDILQIFIEGDDKEAEKLAFWLYSVISSKNSYHTSTGDEENGSL